MPTLQVGIDPSGAIVGSKKAVSAFNNLINSSKRAGFTLGQAGGSMDKVGKAGIRLNRVIGGLTAGFSAMLAARAAVKTIASFEEVMAQLEGVTNATEATMQQFNKTARDLGATTKFSATEAGDGLLFLARAGFTAEQAIAAIPATLNLAAAGMLELGEAADIASNVLSQFGLAAEETERVADILVNTANNANTNVQQLAEAMKLVGPVAGAMGRSLEETAAALGVLGDSGIQASLAGTNLRGVFSALLGPTSKAAKELKRMKISLDDVNPEKNDLISIFEKFGAANITAAEAVRIFGRRNAAAALIFAASTEKMHALNKAYEDNKGKSQEVADIMSRTLTGSFKSMISSIQEAFISIGDSGFGGALKETIISITGVVRALVGMGATLGDSRAKYEAIAKAIKFVAVAATALIAIKVAAWLNTINISFKALTVAMAANPFTVAAVAISALIAAIVVFSGKTDEAAKHTEALNKALEGTKSAADALVEAQIKLNRATTLGDLQAQLSAQKEMARVLTQLSIKYRGLKSDIERGAFEPGTKLGELMKRGLVPVTEELARVIKEAGLESEAMGGKLTKARHIQQLVNGEWQQAIVMGADLNKIIERMEKRISLLGGEAEKGADTAKIMDDIAKAMARLTDAQLKAPKGGRFKTTVDEEDISRITEAKERISALRETIIDLTAAESRRGDLIGLTNEERAAFEAYNSVREEALEIAKQEGLYGDLAQERADEIIGKYQEQTAELIKQTEITRALIAADKVRKVSQEKIARAAKMVGNAFARAFEDAITGAKSLKEAIKNLALELSRLVLRQTVTQPLANAISGAIAAEFSGGGTVAADTTDTGTGGMTTNTMGFSGASTGILAARISGPEVGGSGGGGTTVHVTQIINTPDATSFKKSEKQIMDGVKRRMNR